MRTGQEGREGAALQKSFSKGLHIQDLSSAYAKKEKKMCSKNKIFNLKKKNKSEDTYGFSGLWPQSIYWRSIRPLRQNLLLNTSGKICAAPSVVTLVESFAHETGTHGGFTAGLTNCRLILRCQNLTQTDLK